MFFQSLFYFILAFLAAAVEVNIEGAAGWAKNLPTWRKTQGAAAKVYRFLLSGKELTGYHLFLFSFWILIFHIPFVSGLPWSVVRELVILALFSAWSAVEDFLWFALNPAFGLSRFKPGMQMHHKKWLLGLPRDYFFNWGTSILLAAIGFRISGEAQIFISHLTTLGYFLFFSSVAALTIGPLFRSWHSKKINSSPLSGVLKK